MGNDAVGGHVACGLVVHVGILFAVQYYACINLDTDFFTLGYGRQALSSRHNVLPMNDLYPSTSPYVLLCMIDLT
jgi:hypothetical protein